MRDVDPDGPGAIVLRDATTVVAPSQLEAERGRRRMIVASGMRALTAGPLLPGSALAVAAWIAARVAAGAAGRRRAARGPVACYAVGRVLNPVAPRATLEISWTHVEVRRRG
jgi:hypothetical protein